MVRADVLFCAQSGTRTHTPHRDIGPQPIAYTNSAIWAFLLFKFLSYFLW